MELNPTGARESRTNTTPRKMCSALLCSLLPFRTCMHLTLEGGGWDRPAETHLMVPVKLTRFIYL